MIVDEVFISASLVVKVVVDELVTREIPLIYFYVTCTQMLLALKGLEIHDYEVMGWEKDLQICAFDVAVIACNVCDLAQFSIIL